MRSCSSIKYLLTIYQLSGGQTAVRSVEIARALGVSRASVVKSLKLLMEAGLIWKESYGTVQFTPLGLEESQKLYNEFVHIYQFFVQNLSLAPETAWEDAVTCLCRLSPQCKARLIAQSPKVEISVQKVF